MSSGPTTDTGMTAAPVSISCAFAYGDRSIPVTPPLRPSAFWRASIDAASFLRGHRFSSMGGAYVPRPVSLPPMATGQLIEMKGEGREAFAGVLRFYEL